MKHEIKIESTRSRGIAFSHTGGVGEVQRWVSSDGEIWHMRPSHRGSKMEVRKCIVRANVMDDPVVYSVLVGDPEFSQSSEPFEFRTVGVWWVFDSRPSHKQVAF